MIRTLFIIWPRGIGNPDFRCVSSLGCEERLHHKVALTTFRSNNGINPTSTCSIGFKKFDFVSGFEKKTGHSRQCVRISELDRELDRDLLLLTI